MNPVIRLTGVSKRFGSVRALDDVSLQIQPGTVCARSEERRVGKECA